MTYTDPPLRVAAVGLGWVCRNRHLPTMVANSRYRLVGAIDRNEDVAAAIARQFGMAHHGVGDRLTLEAFPWLAEVDAISIATAPQAHHPLAMQALALGKHVLTEKPFAMVPEQGRELAQVARERQLAVGVVHNFQFSTSFRHLERDLASGKLGRWRSIVARQFGNPGRRLPAWYETLPLGLFYDESPHLLYLIRRLCGDRTPILRRSDGVKSTQGLETPAMMEALYTVEIEGSIRPISLLMSFEAPVSEWHLAVLCEEGMGVVDLFRDIYAFIPNDGQHKTRDVVRTSVCFTWQHWAQHFSRGLLHVRGKLRYGNDEVFDRFAKAALTGAPLRAIGAVDACAVLEMQHELIQSTHWRA